MAHTPLFSLLRRSFAVARQSLTSARPASELLDELRGARRAKLTRRELVGGMALAGAGLAMGCAGLARPVRRGTPRAAVVGGGIAGLTAAYRLRTAGVPVRLFEAQERVGGRMFSLRGRFVDGQVAELGGELVDTGHVHLRALADELCIPLDDLETDAPELDRDVWFLAGRRRSEAEVVDAFRPVAAQVAAARAAIGGDGSVSWRAPNGAAALDHQSIAEWLDSAGVSGWFRALLDVAYTTEYGLETGEQSALNLLLMIDPTPSPFQVFGASDERFHIRGGNDGVPAELARRLGGVVETGTRLEALASAADGSLRLEVRRGVTSETVTADHVVLALPFTLLRDVRLDVELPLVKRRAIAELGYGTNAKLMTGYAERVWRIRHRSNGSVLADLPFQLTWETSRAQPGRAGILTDFTGGAAGLALGKGTAGEQAERFVSSLEQVFPGVSGERSGMAEARFHWPSFPFTRGSYACYRPGQWTAFGGAEGEAVGTLHFAGEHCSTEAQGFMEGGCATGEAAASEILAALGLPMPDRRPASSAA